MTSINIYHCYFLTNVFWLQRPSLGMFPHLLLLFIERRCKMEGTICIEMSTNHTLHNAPCELTHHVHSPAFPVLGICNFHKLPPQKRNKLCTLVRHEWVHWNVPVAYAAPSTALSYTTVQWSAVQYSTVQYSTVQYMLHIQKHMNNVGTTCK